MTAPALRAGSGAIALSPTHAVVGGLSLRGLPLGGPRALALLDGTRGLARVAREAHVDPAWLAGAVDVLAGHGALETEPPTGLVGLAGVGRLASAVEEVLVGERVTVVRSEPSAGWSSLACVVVAPDAVGPDRVLLDRLAREDVPHLLVLPEPGGAAVGPFVLPGRTPCCTCVDLALAARDPGWGRRSLAAARALARPGHAATAWAAGLAARHVLAHLAGEVPDSVATSWHLDAAGVGARRWELHPGCGCALVPTGSARAGLAA